jgi:hypothetical protein
VTQGVGGASFHLSALAEGVRGLAPGSCRRAGTPQPSSWCDHASAWPCGTDRPGPGMPVEAFQKDEALQEASKLTTYANLQGLN